ncbi:aldose 1-epimerase [Aureimonas sp. AU40]|uniref:aldose 1-epimerase n=1 Tax=Aureimonas sp. AU40 TaxID=1637747 RepID=UPI0007855457|nr:aldose 1-epimerase [Aureimonas sp. AU40]
MGTLHLASEGLEARVSTKGGRILGLDWRRDGAERTPLLCPAAEGARPEARSAFALLPFGNRLPGNAFRFQGREHRFLPNTPDPFYLHGDGWLADWRAEEAGPDRAHLAFRHEGEAYRYDARQEIGIRDGGLRIALSITNAGEAPMPFGLGWHPFLPRTPRTRLQTEAKGFWTEAPGHLPGAPAPLPADLDFAAPAPLPARWVNNALEGWSGRAGVVWPERRAGLALSVDPVFAHAFLFLPDQAFAPARDWFCFEPMTHLPGEQDRPDLGGLAPLAPGETLAGTIRLTPFSPLAETDRP